MYEKERTGIIVKTKSGSVYILERLRSIQLSENFKNTVSYDMSNAEQSRVYMISQSRQFGDKITFEHPVIAVSLSQNFMNGSNLDFIVTDAEVNGRFKYHRLHSSEIESVRAFRDEKRHDVVNDKFAELKNNYTTYSFAPHHDRSSQSQR